MGVQFFWEMFSEDLSSMDKHIGEALGRGTNSTDDTGEERWCRKLGDGSAGEPIIHFTAESTGGRPSPTEKAFKSGAK